MTNVADCSDFLAFQEQLKKLRDIDDKLIYALNTSIPTDSFKGQVHPEENCKNLHASLKKGYEYRQAMIKDCILVYANKVKGLKDTRDNATKEKASYDLQLDKEFRGEQRKLRLLQSEMNIEDILKQRSYKLFDERCRQYYKIDSL